jgi:hypothetical protein
LFFSERQNAGTAAVTHGHPISRLGRSEGYDVTEDWSEVRAGQSVCVIRLEAIRSHLHCWSGCDDVNFFLKIRAAFPGAGGWTLFLLRPAECIQHSAAPVRC